MHPYVGAFFAEGNASIVLVMMGGQARVICSEVRTHAIYIYTCRESIAEPCIRRRVRRAEG